MKDQLIKIYNLKPDATEDQIVEAATRNMKIAGDAGKHHAREAAIRKKINESVGALHRDQAIEVLKIQKHPLFVPEA